MKRNNYRPATYSVEIRLARSPDDVFDHLIDLSKWWPEEFVEEDLKLGAEFILRTGDSHYSKNRVIEFVPNKKLAWLTIESIRRSDNFDWTGTKFIIDLVSERDNTLLRFTYDGVVLKHEAERLAQICDITIKDIFYNFIMTGKAIQHC